MAVGLVAVLAVLWLAVLTINGRDLSAQLRQVHADVDRLAASLQDAADRVEAQQEQLSDQAAQQQDALRRLGEAEATLSSDAPISEIARRVRPSVYTVETPLAIGTGFVISDRSGEAVVITNYHVVSDVWDAGRREVTLYRGAQTLTGRLTNVSVEHDLAVIAPSVPLTPLEVDRNPPEVGELVVAVGSPYGLEGTVSSGIVSALREDRIQFSAPVSPGNSGGPVVDESGAVVGVVVEKIAGVGFEGLSFAIPAETLCSTVTSCKD